MPQDRADFLAGQLCAVMANIHRTKDAPMFEAASFIPRLEDIEEETQEVTAEPEMVDIEASSKALMAMLGKTEK